MRDAQTFAEAYIGFWNAADPAERAQRYDAAFTPDATYADPVMRGAGREEIGGLVAAARTRFPGFVFRLMEPASGYGEFVRFRWAFGPAGAEPPIEGSDVVTVKGDRIAQVIGFLDKLPQ